jgi:branched-subunit amino acid aminotransferase/4-amino-4-deoxychorismate lyase
MSMNELRFYAVTDDGAVALAVAAGATDFLDLYGGLSLGTYSALRTFEHNKFLHLDWHIARTRLSMELLGMKYRWDEKRFRRALHEVVSSYPAEDVRVRFDVLVEPVQVGETMSREVIALKPFIPVPAAFYREGIGVVFAPALQRELARAKSADFVEKRSQFAPGRKQDLYEHLILDDAGYILEGTMTNFWAVRDGEVWTAGEGMLEGVTRKILLALLPQMGIPVRFEAVHKDEIGALEEAAISGSSRAVMPVVRIGGVQVGEGRPGPVFQRILAAYREYVAGAVRTAVSE